VCAAYLVGMQRWGRLVGLEPGLCRCHAELGAIACMQQALWQGHFQKMVPCVYSTRAGGVPNAVT
jgi:hypothetical protein